MRTGLPPYSVIIRPVRDGFAENSWRAVAATVRAVAPEGRSRLVDGMVCAPIRDKATPPRPEPGRVAGWLLVYVDFGFLVTQGENPLDRLNTAANSV